MASHTPPNFVFSSLIPQPSAEALPAVVLRHTSSQHTHHDVLIALPHPRNLLWTVRTPWPSILWRRFAPVPFECITAHRQMYLNYEGPVSGDRGYVSRIDAGWCTGFSNDSLRPTCLSLVLSQFRGTLNLQWDTETCGYWILREQLGNSHVILPSLTK